MLVLEKRKELTMTTQIQHHNKKFKLIRKYTQIEELTPKVINELIDKIIIHQPIGRGKNRQIKLEIHYRFIGDI